MSPVQSQALRAMDSLTREHGHGRFTLTQISDRLHQQTDASASSVMLADALMDLEELGQVRTKQGDREMVAELVE